ncbi:MAG: HNH endonuclease [Proteobacteria bacterium]|nr:HNH endonuclease [Pseudomonadota bacterium]
MPAIVIVSAILFAYINQRIRKAFRYDPGLESVDESEIKFLPELTDKPVALAQNGYYYLLKSEGNGKYKLARPLHREVAYKRIFTRQWLIFRFPVLFFKTQYPGMGFSDLIVHHIDKNKTNNDPGNLAIITSYEHDHKIDHDNIEYGNRLSGIRELRRAGIKTPHIPEQDS